MHLNLNYNNPIFYFFQMSKVYISNLDSPLGYHLVDLLRTDHINPHSPTLIIGSSSIQPSPPIYQTINFSRFPQLSCRAVLECDLVILNLQHSSHQAEVIIKFLENCHSTLNKSLRVIGISTTMTWEGLRTFEIQKQTEKQRILNSVLDESNWRRITWTDNGYSKRVPNNLYMKAFELQNMLLKLNKLGKINATVVAHGMLYGRQNTALQKEIINSLSGTGLACYGNGDNLIPLTHIQTFLESISFLIDQKQLPFAIVCDHTQYTQKQIKQFIIQVTGSTEPLTYRQPLFLVKEQCDWSINLTLQSASKQIISIASSRSFEKYVKQQLLYDFCDYNCYQPKQYLIIVDKFDEETLRELAEQLRGRCKLILQEEIDKIDQQIIVKMTPPQPEVPVKKQHKSSFVKPQSAQLERQQVHYYRQALQSVMRGKKHQNFILVCRQNMLPFINRDFVYSKFTEIVPEEQDTNQESHIIFESDDYYKQFNLAKPSNIITANDQNASQFAKQSSEKYQFEASARKDDQLILLNQYLLDNVLLPISQAKFALKSQKKQLNLRNFIEELKEILAKANNKSLLNSHCES